MFNGSSSSSSSIRRIAIPAATTTLASSFFPGIRGMASKMKVLIDKDTPAFSSAAAAGLKEVRALSKPSKFTVIGHRGSGMNVLFPEDKKFNMMRENTIMSFNAAGKFDVDFVEFDVQVTSDGCPIIFHDSYIITQTDGNILQARVTELTLSEFLSYGLQNEPGNMGKPLFRQARDGCAYSWKVEMDQPHCTLQEAFERVDPRLGFNVELKFDDNESYSEEKLTSTLGNILEVVNGYAKDRRILFSTFQPDAALLARRLQDDYPVFFLTDGGNTIYPDVRRNSLDEAKELCVTGGLQGIVSEVQAVFRNPDAVSTIKEAKLGLITYGKLNNLPTAVYMQHSMGLDGVIVDLVSDVTAAVADFHTGKWPEMPEPTISFILQLIHEFSGCIK